MLTYDTVVVFDPDVVVARTVVLTVPVTVTDADVAFGLLDWLQSNIGDLGMRPYRCGRRDCGYGCQRPGDGAGN